MKSAYIYNKIDQAIEDGNRVFVAHFGLLASQFFGLTIDAFAIGALSVNGVIEQAFTIEDDTPEPCCLPIEILKTAFSSCF